MQCPSHFFTSEAHFGIDLGGVDFSVIDPASNMASGFELQMEECSTWTVSTGWILGSPYVLPCMPYMKESFISPVRLIFGRSARLGGIFLGKKTSMLLFH